MTIRAAAINTDNLGAFGDLAISATTSSKTSASFCLLFFDEDRNFFVVPFGQVDCGCGGKFRRGLRYWAFLFFVLCAPFCCVRGKFFGVPFGQVDCGCGGKFKRGLRYWVILLIVRHPAACGGWALEWGVVCDAAATAMLHATVGTGDQWG